MKIPQNLDNQIAQAQGCRRARRHQQRSGLPLRWPHHARLSINAVLSKKKPLVNL
jgi:hypothetical protein